MQGQRDKNIAVCYSGGLDSTFVGFVMGRRYTGKVHLVTALHRYGHIFPGLAKRHVGDLQRLLGADRVVHHYIHISKEFREVVLGRLLQNYRTYGSSFVVCLGCNMTMDAHLIAYCLEHRVSTAFFGFTPKGSNMAVMSLPETGRERRRFYADYGLLYRAPIMELHMEKPEERHILRSQGIWPGWNFRKIAMGVQPMCMMGVAIHHKDIFFGWHPQYDRNHVVAFLRDKAPVVRRLIAELLAARGIRMEERIQEMRAANADEWDRYGPDTPPLNDLVERAETAELADLPIIAAREFPSTVPWRGHATLSRDGRELARLPEPQVPVPESETVG